jgi:hypothetical protein
VDPDEEDSVMHTTRALGGVLAAVSLSVSVDAAELLPHRATYALSLEAARSGSVVTGIEGTMAIDWAEVCEGWTITQRLKFKLIGVDGEELDNDIGFSSFESHDGLTYRFALRAVRDGEVTEELRGRAQLDGKGQPGKAIYQEPAGEIRNLPKGTVFATEHTILLLKAAEAGQALLSLPVFAGGTLDGALDVNALISPRQPGQARPGLDPAAGRPFWRVRLAFFRSDEPMSEPEYEVAVRMLDNGVGAEFTFEYEEFAMRAALDKLEMLPRPRC